MNHLPRPSSTEDQIKTKPKTVFSPSSWKKKKNSNLKTKVEREDSMDDTNNVMSSRVVLKDKEVENDDLEKEKGKKQMVVIKR